mgnify:CR=1 FL=1|jgi:hypothetical protein
MTTKTDLNKELMELQQHYNEKRKVILNKISQFEKDEHIKQLENIKNKIPKPKSKGVGDTIKKVTNALGIKQCGGCKRRQEKLNRLIPYKEEPKKE